MVLVQIFVLTLLCGGVLCHYDGDAPVWSDGSDENTVVPEVKSRAKDDDDDKILEIFNECECVVYYLCDDDNFIITDGRKIISPRLNRKTNVTRIACKKEFNYCCKLRSNQTIIPTNKNPNIFPNSTISSNKRQTKCGWQKPTFHQRILTKEPTTIPGEFPWMAAIIQKKTRGTGYEFKCAGSIIHPQVILTAAHCVKRAKQDALRVVYNITVELDFSENGPAYYDRKGVSKVVLHGDFYSGGLYNDVALLILDGAIELNGLVNSVCLPQQGEVFNRTDCWAAGWGDTKPGGNDDVRYLRKVKIPMVSPRHCQALLKTTRLGLDFTLHESFVCAGGAKDEDTCYGDGGGPLVCPRQVHEGRYVQTGIVSWGVGCGEEGIPGVYTNVALFRNWIGDEMRKKGLEFL